MSGLAKNKWIYILPALHLSAYFLTYFVGHPLELSGFPILLIADFPFSIGVLVLAWKYPLLANLWILVVGTAWWYLLSRIIVGWISNRFGDRQPQSLSGSPNPWPFSLRQDAPRSCR